MKVWNDTSNAFLTKFKWLRTILDRFAIVVLRNLRIYACRICSGKFNADPTADVGLRMHSYDKQTTHLTARTWVEFLEEDQGPSQRQILT